MVASGANPFTSRGRSSLKSTLPVLDNSGHSRGRKDHKAHTANMLLLGLTGSIATGKSTVSSILSSPPYNLPIIDADKVARQVVEPGTSGYNKIVSHFGPSTPDLLVPPTAENGGENGHNGKGRPLNRPALGRRVFGEGKVEDRTALNKIVHPAVRGEMYKQMLYAYLRGNWAVVLDVPLLFESGWEPLCGTIMVVAVKDAAVQMQRLRARDEHLTEEDAKNRVASQWDVRDKAERCLRRGEKAGVVVWNDGDQEDLKKEIDRVMSIVKEGSPQWWAWMLLLFPPLGLMSGGWSYVRSWYIKRQWEQEKTREKAKL
jgi:dephospho-CoA kinase